MKIIVLANAAQREELLLKETNEETEMLFVDSFSALLKHPDGKAYFIFIEDMPFNQLHTFTSRPVFINSVVSTLKELQHTKNISRINGWPTFLQRDTWEIATQDEQAVKEIFDMLQWKYLVMADEPGMAAARIVSMIINEAFYALGDGISTPGEIDVAMKLGTNYPYGPFEWAKKIGIKNIYQLLNKLADSDKRYSVAPYLQNKITEPAGR